MYKMNEMVNKYLLAGDKFMYLKQPGFTYSACGPFTKNKERIQKFKETRDTSYIYKNGLDKACFQHDMTYVDFKDIARRTASDNLLLWFINFLIKSPLPSLDKSVSGSGVGNNEIKQDLQLAKELHKPIS